MVGPWVGIPTPALLLGVNPVGVTPVAWRGKLWEDGRMKQGVLVGQARRGELWGLGRKGGGASVR